jgi:hypothetical protein
MDTSLPGLVGSTTLAEVALFAAYRQRWRWLELGGWYAEAKDTRSHLKGCACWSQSPHRPDEGERHPGAVKPGAAIIDAEVAARSWSSAAGRETGATFVG